MTNPARTNPAAAGDSSLSTQRTPYYLTRKSGLPVAGRPGPASSGGAGPVSAVPRSADLCRGICRHVRERATRAEAGDGAAPRLPPPLRPVESPPSASDSESVPGRGPDHY